MTFQRDRSLNRLDCAAVAPDRALDCSVDTAYATRLCFPIDLGVLKGFPDWAPRREIRPLQQQVSGSM